MSRIHLCNEDLNERISTLIVSDCLWDALKIFGTVGGGGGGADKISESRCSDG